MRSQQQVQLRTLSGRTALLENAAGVASLRSRVAALEGVPAELLRLSCGGRDLADAEDAAHLGGRSVTVLLRLLGGKGGFGAMLRTAGARGVKTTNFDACRDLNGRRLRHVNAEAALQDWESKAEERKLKKQQEAAKNAKPGGPALIERFDDDAYEEMLEGTRKGVSDALAAGLSAAAASSSDGADAPAATATAAAAAAPAAEGKRKAPMSVAEGKRKAPAAASAPAAKAAKHIYDPLAALGGEGDTSSSEEEA